MSAKHVFMYFENMTPAQHKSHYVHDSNLLLLKRLLFMSNRAQNNDKRSKTLNNMIHFKELNARISPLDIKVFFFTVCNVHVLICTPIISV